MRALTEVLSEYPQVNYHIVNRQVRAWRRLQVSLTSQFYYPLLINPFLPLRGQRV